MLCCIAIGIREYGLSSLSDIPCAAKDAQKVYQSFRRIMEEDFNDCTSICVSDISLRGFEELLCMVADSLQEEADTKIVVYFSGHAGKVNEKYSLFFRDYDGRTGFYYIDQFQNAFSSFKNKVLLILDCCRAGGALSVATCSETMSEVSVLAACSVFETAKFDDSGSQFTKVLCDSMEDIYENETSFALETLTRYMNKHKYNDLLVNVGASSDLSFKFRDFPSNQTELYDFPDNFLQKIYRNNLLVREAMWYSLDEMSSAFVLNTCRKYFVAKNPVEASWLVRRAIGSTLSNHAGNDRIREFLLELLDSDYWQNQCVALIGLRYLIEFDDFVFKRVIDRVRAGNISRVDAVWLANLYASDNPQYDPEAFKDTALRNTAWGTVEVFKTHLQHNQSLDITEWEKARFYNDVKLEHALLKFQTGEVPEIIRKIYMTPMRGRFPQNTKAKFLLSALYGNWRNQISPELQSYFDTHSTEEIQSELGEACSIPSAERRMALFAYFKDNPSRWEKFGKCLLWGLNDNHPWVRRSAAEFFQCIPEYKDELYRCYMDMRQDINYPGILDFYLTCPQMWRDELLERIKERHDLLPGDMRSLEHAFTCG